MEINDYVFLYNEKEDKLTAYKIKGINKSTYRVEKKEDVGYNSFPVQKDGKGVDWWASYEDFINCQLDEQLKDIKKIKKQIENHKLKLMKSKKLQLIQ